MIFGERESARRVRVAAESVELDLTAPQDALRSTNSNFYSHMRFFLFIKAEQIVCFVFSCCCVSQLAICKNVFHCAEISKTPHFHERTTLPAYIGRETASQNCYENGARAVPRQFSRGKQTRGRLSASIRIERKMLTLFMPAYGKTFIR